MTNSIIASKTGSFGKAVLIQYEGGQVFAKLGKARHSDSYVADHGHALKAEDARDLFSREMEGRVYAGELSPADDQAA